MSTSSPLQDKQINVTIPCGNPLGPVQSPPEASGTSWAERGAWEWDMSGSLCPLKMRSEVRYTRDLSAWKQAWQMHLTSEQASSFHSTEIFRTKIGATRLCKAECSFKMENIAKRGNKQAWSAASNHVMDLQLQRGHVFITLPQLVKCHQRGKTK